MTHGSLFSGIGGFELAAEWSGFTNVFSCEIEPFNQRVLKHYWPNSQLHTDVKEFPASDYTGRIDILTGGFPCQPYSTAGKRLGKEDDRHLWPFMLEIIREIAPTYVVGENVRGLVNWSGGLVFEEVCADLEAAGYDVQPFILPASGVGAPHRRDRVWFVAWNPNGWREFGNGTKREVQTKHPDTFGVRDRSVADAKSSRNPKAIDQRRESQLNDRAEIWDRVGADGEGGNATDTNHKRAGAGFGEVQETNGEVPKRHDDAQFSNSGERWDEFPTQSPICGGDDGLPRELDGITFSKWRNQSIKAYGNAIVPQVAYQIFQAIKQMHND